MAVPPAAVRSTDRNDREIVTNLSLGLKRPLYTSCNQHSHPPAHTERQENRFLCLNALPRMPSPSPSRSPSRHHGEPSPFLRLPAELRLQIYSLLLLPRQATDLLPSYEKVHSSTQDYFDYDKKQHGTDLPLTANLTHPHLLIRTLDPDRYTHRYPSHRPHPLRTSYSVRCDRFRSACKSTTYHCVNTPRIEDQLAIMRTSQRIHAECADLLYSHYTFDFDTHVEAIVPFLSDLTPFARSRLQSIRLVKRALAYEKEFDRCEWSNALRYLTAQSSGIHLRRLELGVVAGRPGENGWDRVPQYSAEYFRTMKDSGEEAGWMQYLFEFRGLRELEVKAIVEHCPPTTNSEAIAKYVRFSASVEGGFREFLRGQLVAVHA
ncbi:hypothetical protein BAUCODRAFT_37567 [Baudoinia panamericana UAMH 10762]|uniref:Uncharacterized protein n=1 Tax=Baudoinia panamericana (strain UAMH 10762) TaxID=717646 RepID=M2N161_BAUPA|nr:uncharacterized protein BAUCODRAFT_37567 [Baudoinia panamericana UAMH 10762]EMC92664.1 hypothetical protein BAUCODRAFT_37567 [Baudoinia panamericana UAMH 10762]